MIKKKLQCLLKPILLLFLLAAIGCNKEPKQWQEKYILYKDSLCKIPLDTILLFEKDSNYVKKDGYYRIYGFYEDDYDNGKIKNQKKVGVWKYYNKNVLSAEENYNGKGEQDGFFIDYNSQDGTFYRVSHYVNGTQEGIQKEYHPKNILARVYTLNKSYEYRDEYVCYNEKGEIIYKENFGKEGTGYCKEFLKNEVINQGAYLKGKPVGVHTSKDYLYDNSLVIQQIFYNEKGRFYMINKIGNLKPAYETKGDSMVFYYTKNRTKIKTFLKGKNIKNVVYKDTIV